MWCQQQLKLEKFFKKTETVVTEKKNKQKSKERKNKK